VNIRVKITPADSILIVSLFAISVIWFAALLISAERGGVVDIHNARGLYKELSLNENIAVSVPGPLGDSVVQIEDGTVVMLSSPCPNKVCIHTGKIKYSGESIICIPNKVFVLIRAEKADFDAVTY
jgi:hypothetical protein